MILWEILWCILFCLKCFLRAVFPIVLYEKGKINVFRFSNIWNIFLRILIGKTRFLSVSYGFLCKTWSKHLNFIFSFLRNTSLPWNLKQMKFKPTGHLIKKAANIWRVKNTYISIISTKVHLCRNLANESKWAKSWFLITGYLIMSFELKVYSSLLLPTVGVMIIIVKTKVKNFKMKK